MFILTPGSGSKNNQIFQSNSSDYVHLQHQPTPSHDLYASLRIGFDPNNSSKDSNQDEALFPKLNLKDSDENESKLNGSKTTNNINNQNGKMQKKKGRKFSSNSRKNSNNTNNTVSPRKKPSLDLSWVMVKSQLSSKSKTKLSYEDSANSMKSGSKGSTNSNSNLSNVSTPKATMSPKSPANGIANRSGSITHRPPPKQAPPKAPKLFPVIFPSKDALIIGDGNKQAIFIDNNLNFGVSSQCVTFKSPVLVANKSGDFQINTVEVWSVE